MQTKKNNKYNKKITYLNRKILKKIFYRIVPLAEKITNEYWAYVTRPGRQEEFMQASLSVADIKVGIVLQGAILKKDNFTLETVKLYRRIMPHAVIVVSTWKNEDNYVINEFEKSGIEVVRTEEPLDNGIQNINMQVVSAREGIRRARELGCEYVMKTRTDQRFYKADLDSYCLSLIEAFPIGSAFDDCKMKKRIIVMQGAVGINIFQPFYISDFMYFGVTDDVYKIFSYPLEPESYNEKNLKEYLQKIKKGLNTGEYLRKVAPEVKLLENYVRTNIDRDFDYTVQYFWKIIKECFITVSNEEIGFFWPKYKSRFYENNLLLNYLSNSESNLKRTETWSFSTWLNLYCGRLDYRREFEDLKNCPA